MTYSKKRSRESRAAIERIYIAMRHLLMRGSYKPNGISGQALKEALTSLEPEIYGDINDPEKVELDGLLYVAERLPKGIEECRFIRLIAREGFLESGHVPIIPQKRRRNCYRIDEHRMYVEMSRGRSDIYDILTHLTFLSVEAEKIKQHALDVKGHINDNWLRLEEVVQFEKREEAFDEKRALVYLSNVLGRTVEETSTAVQKFEKSTGSNSLYHLVYWMGKVAIEEELHAAKKEIHFSAELRNVLGHHVYGEKWANGIKEALQQRNWLQRPLHIVSANLHSFVNILWGFSLEETKDCADVFELAALAQRTPDVNYKIRKAALGGGLVEIEDQSGTNLGVQLIDMAAVDWSALPYAIEVEKNQEAPILLVMDYAFGEQAYECMDELLKAYETGDVQHQLTVSSISIMGKAGILNGNKGDVMVPTAHVFEGTGDNYPLENDFSAADFEGSGLRYYEGSMITVLGTSLQNRDVLHHFLSSTWHAIGLEMEGAHYQKAIQSASKIRRSITSEVKVRYAYYASDNPLVTGSTLSSGSLGAEGVKPTYWISLKILEKIINNPASI
jgi:hypothetical protein